MTKRHFEISNHPSSKQQIPKFSQIFVFPPSVYPDHLLKIFKIAAELKASIMTLKELIFDCVK